MGFALVLLSPAPQARAQLDRLDKATLVDELADQGMGELLLHLIETEPSGDAVLDQKMRLAQFQVRMRDPELSPEQRDAAYEQALAVQRGLIADHPDHEQRPMWQTDLAEMLLVDGLRTRHRRAGAFVLYGVPSAEQLTAVAEAAPEALRLLADADLRFFQLEGMLPREADHVQKRVQTGLWDRMMEEYWRGRTRYLLGTAALLTAALPAHATYFQKLDGAVLQQASDPVAERARLLSLAGEKLQPLIQRGATETVRRESAAMIGRSLTLADQSSSALDVLRSTLAEPAVATTADLHVRLAGALARAAGGRASEAAAELEALRRHPRVAVDLLARVLVTDALHRVLLAEVPPSGPERSAALARAYAPYLALLDDPAVAKQRAGLKTYLYDRWAASLDPEADTAQLPAAVQMAVGEITRMRGQTLALRGQQEQDAEATAQARPLLEQAVAVNQRLLETQPTASIATTARFNLALARYWLAPQSVGNVLEAGKELADTARAAPSHHVSEQAITLAVDLLRQVATLDAPPAGAMSAYADAVDVLLEKFGTSRAADNERYFYALTVPARRGDDATVAAVLSGIPEDHETYFPAQVERLAAMARVARSTGGEAQASAIDRFAATARQVKAAAERAGEHTARLAARLALARVQALRGNADAALAELDQLQRDVANEPVLLTQVLQSRINILVETGALDAAASAAKQMMVADADAGAAVVDAVLNGLNARIDALRDRADRELAPSVQAQLRSEAARLAGASATLAKLLLQWAQDQGYSADELAAYQLLHARALRQSGNAAEAAEVLAPLAERYPDDAEVLRAYAGALFDRGDEAALGKAATIYDRLIAAYAAPYPRPWWEAWLRRLQIMQRQGADPQQIRLRVRQLRFTDPSLGGEPYKRLFEAMLGE